MTGKKIEPTESRIIHENLNSRYRICFEQAASTKGQLGFKVEANGDDLNLVKAEAGCLLDWARNRAPTIEVK